MEVENCDYYQQVVDKLTFFAPGTLNPYSHFAEPNRYTTKTKPSQIGWKKVRISHWDYRFNKPVAFCTTFPCPCADEKPECVPEKWIPVDMVVTPNAVMKNKREAIHEVVPYERSVRTSEGSELTKMLPLIGRVVRRDEKEWGHAQLNTGPEMTNRQKTFFPKINAGVTRYAHQFTVIHGAGPHYY